MTTADHIAALHRAAAARRQLISTVELPALPAPVGPVIVTITPTELWCAHCGAQGGESATPHAATYKNVVLKPLCGRCGRPTLIRAAEVLDRLGVVYALR